MAAIGPSAGLKPLLEGKNVFFNGVCYFHLGFFCLVFFFFVMLLLFGCFRAIPPACH